MPSRASDREAKDGQLTTGSSGRHIAAAEPERYAAEANTHIRILHLSAQKDRSERYFVSVLVETEVKPLKKAKAEVGIDVGIKTLARTSDGQRLENPRPLVRREKQLKRRQRRFSRKVKGSNNRKKAKLKVAKLHAKIRDTRADTIQKFTTKIIRENQAIFVEGLNVAGMLKNGNLAKHLADAAFAEIFRELEYKAHWYGRTYVELDRSSLRPNCARLVAIC
jgi:putative transposase